MLAITTTIDGVRFEVQLAPRASRNAVIGEHDGALKIAITAPPVEGAANAALVAFLAEHLGLAQRDVRITRGQSEPTQDDRGPRRDRRGGRRARGAHAHGRLLLRAEEKVAKANIASSRAARAIGALACHRNDCRREPLESRLRLVRQTG